MTSSIRRRLVILSLVAATLSPLAAQAEGGRLTGQFTGASNHVTTGGVTITTATDGRTVVVLDEKFSLDGAPDPRVGLGRDGHYVEGADLGELKKINGGQIYVVPAGLDVKDFNEVYIWCEEFSVPLGVARLG